MLSGGTDLGPKCETRQELGKESLIVEWRNRDRSAANNIHPSKKKKKNRNKVKQKHGIRRRLN